MRLRKIKCRIKEYPLGYVAQVQRSIFGFKYWTHLISVAGIDSKPWYFKSTEETIRGAKLYLECGIIEESIANDPFIFERGEK